MVEARIGDCLSTFTLPHWAMALSATGREAATQRLLAAMGASSNPVVREVALPVSRAVVAHRRKEFAKALELMADPTFGLVILDELNIALRYEYLDLHAVVAALHQRRAGLHVVVTGRNAKPELIAAADLVTEMTPVKHHFAAGVKAQAGIEY